MVNNEELRYNMTNEGNLARTWEKKLRSKPTPPKPRRRFNKGARVVFWVSAVWGMGLLASIMAVHVLVMAYQVDALQARYTALQRQTQGLALTVTKLRSPQALAADSRKMHIALQSPMVVSPKVGRSKPSSSATTAPRVWYQGVSRWIAGVRGALTGK